ncbi:MAG: hypothetical protein U0992_02220 [Planctomycetaceae bacterium]
MLDGMTERTRFLAIGALTIVLIATCQEAAQAQMVPGTGTLLNSDDFEDESWNFSFNLPKSSKEEDEQIRYPLGASANGMWMESPKRGVPDQVQRIATPAGGLEGSKGALMLRTRDTGIPGHPMSKQCQDDFILKARPVSLSYTPNFVVRVFLPQWDQWEQRHGVSFGIRVGMQGPQEKQEPVRGFKKLFGRGFETVTSTEPYYPGFFIQFNPKTAQNPEPHAVLLVRADEMGHDIPSKNIKTPGWWTFGMSITSDGRCHYYAKSGVGDLTSADYITSTLPYGIRGTYFNTIFFNVCSADNGRSWSTPWVIDDPKVYYGGQPSQFVQQPNRMYRR